MDRWLRVCLRVSLWVAVVVVAGSAPARAADVYVAAGASLQAAIDNAQPGDRLLLAPGATYVGNFRLPDKGSSTTYITIRSAAADTLLPGDGSRISPGDAANLPKIKSPNTSPALSVAAGAHHWRLQFLEFQANDRGSGDIISLGAGGTTQTLLSQVPHDLVLDRLYIHGDPVIGQKRGVALHSGATWLINCYIADIKGVGFDTQAVLGYNGPGPYSILNNYLEAAGENFMLGGASPKITDLIPSDIEFRGNHLFKPLAWRSPILAVPAGITASGGTGGSLPAATYSYRIVASRPTAQDAWAYSERSAEVTVTVAAGGRITLSWAPVANATTYRVYRGSAPGAQDRYFTTTSTTLVDDGVLAGTSDTGASIRATVWTVKNLFELKMGQRVRVRGNLMENCWKESQVGYGVLFTPRNPDGTSPWIYVRDVEFSGNLVRHTGAGVQIEGYDSSSTSQQTRRITIGNNIFDDISSTRWGGPGRWVQIGNGPSDITIDHNTVLHDGHIVYAYGGTYGAEMQVPNFKYTNNLTRHNAYGIMGDGRAYGNDSLNAYFPGAIVARNTFAGGSSSRYPAGNEFPTVTYWEAQFVDVTASDFHLVDASPYRASGTDALDLGAPVSEVLLDAAAARSGTPSGSQAPPVTITTTTLPAGQTGTAYSTTLLAAGGTGTYSWSIAAGALPAGVSLGASTGLVSGTPSAFGSFSVSIRVQDALNAANAATQGFVIDVASTPPIISLGSPANGALLIGTDVALAASASDPDGVVTRVDFYANATLVGSATAAPWSRTWSNVAPGIYRLTATATDDAGLAITSGAVDVTVESQVAVTTVSLPSGQAGTAYAATLTATGGTGAYTWTVVAGQLPAGLSLATSTGVLSGTPTTAGTFTFTVRAEDVVSSSNSGSGTFAVSVAAQAPPTSSAATALPGIVQAEDFDNGGEGLTYHDTTPGNAGGAYRATNVDLEPTADTGGGYNVGWMVPGEWLKYTVTVAASGAYVLNVRVAAKAAGGTFHLEFGGIDKTGPLTIPSTGSDQTWTTLQKTVTLAAGTQVMRLVLDAYGPTGIFGNVNYITVAAAPEVVLYSTDLVLHGAWIWQWDRTAAGGIKALTPDLGWSTPSSPLASPTDYVESTFDAPAGVPYAIWLRIRATGNAEDSDSVWIQFSDATSGGAPVYAIGSASALLVNLERCGGCGVLKWGWQNGAYWLTQASAVTFASDGPHTIRLQVREDGAQIDQIVLSPSRYLSTAPGRVKNDGTIVAKP